MDHTFDMQRSFVWRGIPVTLNTHSKQGQTPTCSAPTGPLPLSCRDSCHFSPSAVRRHWVVHNRWVINYSASLKIQLVGWNQVWHQAKRSVVTLHLCDKRRHLDEAHDKQIYDGCFFLKVIIISRCCLRATTLSSNGMRALTDVVPAQS